MKELEDKLNQLLADQKALLDQATEQKTNLGTIKADLLAKIEAVQKQADAIDAKMQKAVVEQKKVGLVQSFTESPELKDMFAYCKSHDSVPKGFKARIELGAHAVDEMLNRKTVVTAAASTLGAATPGVMQYEMMPGMVIIPRPQLRMRSVIPSSPTNLMRIGWMKETVRPTQASPVAEAGQKLQVAITVGTDYEDVKKIAIILKATDEVLSDAPELDAFIRDSLIARVQEEEDAQILDGAGTGQNLNGLTTQAQDWSLTSYTTALDGYEYGDIIRGAFTQIAADNEMISNPFVVLHPTDYWKIKGTKDSTGRYIYGDPTAAFDIRLWGATVVPTTQMTEGYFLVGSGDARAAVLRTRMGVTVDISTEDDTNFQYNLVTFRVELREALVVRRPNAFCHGALTQSPA